MMRGWGLAVWVVVMVLGAKNFREVEVVMSEIWDCGELAIEVAWLGSVNVSITGVCHRFAHKRLVPN
jgi:hypothetical protein